MPEIESQPKWAKSSLSFTHGKCAGVANLSNGEIAARNSRDIAAPFPALRGRAARVHRRYPPWRVRLRDRQPAKVLRHGPGPASRVQRVNKTSSVNQPVFRASQASQLDDRPYLQP